MTWRILHTRRGQLIEMAATLAAAKGSLQRVLDDFPEEAYGAGDLEHAIQLVGKCEIEIDEAADTLERS